MTLVRTDRAIGVMIVDGRAIVREGLRALMQPEPDLAVVAQAASVSEAKQIAAAPDVVVAALDLPDATRETMVRELRQVVPGCPVLVLAPTTGATLQTVLATGADGYLLETAGAADLVEAIRLLADGKTYLQPSMGVQLARLPRRSDTTPALSPHEERLLGLLALGHTNAEVARLCDVSLRTVEARRARLRQVLGLQTRAELVEYARETGLV
jgi:two-component system response regulator NreC